MSTIIPFSTTEYRRRVLAVQAVMQVRRLDWCILDEPETMGWVSGFSTSENLYRACLVPADGDPVLVIRSLDVPPAAARSWLKSFVGFADWDDPIEVLAARMRKEAGVLRIGADFESNSFTIRRKARLEALLPGCEIVDTEREVWDLRRIKSGEELARMERAAGLLDGVIAKVVTLIREGSSTRDVAAEVAAMYYRAGFDDGLIGYITASKDWDSLHGYVGDEPLSRGNIVHIELLPRFGNYTVRIMRSVVVGHATAEQRQTFEELRRLQDEQFAMMRPGVLASDVDSIIRLGTQSAGLRASYLNISGYTMGYSSAVSQRTSDLHRCFLPTSNWRLEAGMVFHMYTSARGLALSEVVVVTDEGARRLSSFPRVLFDTGPASGSGK